MENGKKSIQNLVSNKYKLRLGDVKFSLNQEEDIFLLHKDTVLLKEPGLYCFLLRCKKPEAKPFIEWVLETVLPREVRKLASVIEEKDAALTLLSDDLKTVKIKYKPFSMKTWHCKHKEMCIRPSYKNVKSKSVTKSVPIDMFLVQMIQVKVTLL